MRFSALETVVLDRDLPEHGLRKGDLGAVTAGTSGSRSSPTAPPEHMAAGLEAQGWRRIRIVERDGVTFGTKPSGLEPAYADLCRRNSVPAPGPRWLTIDELAWSGPGFYWCDRGYGPYAVEVGPRPSSGEPTVYTCGDGEPTPLADFGDSTRFFGPLEPPAEEAAAPVTVTVPARIEATASFDTPCCGERVDLRAEVEPIGTVGLRWIGVPCPTYGCGKTYTVEVGRSTGS